MMSDEERWSAHQKRAQEAWEALCQRCGACCGAAEGDPCEHLDTDAGGFFCRIYADRFGWRRSVSGRAFRCVPIRDILHLDWPGSSSCAYKRLLHQPSGYPPAPSLNGISDDKNAS